MHADIKNRYRSSKIIRCQIPKCILTLQKYFSADYLANNIHTNRFLFDGKAENID